LKCGLAASIGIMGVMGVLGVLGTTTAIASEGTIWGYTGHNGPNNWSELSADFSACSEGKNQSPVNLTNMVEGMLQKNE
jgi:carbonic anhydrase